MIEIYYRDELSQEAQNLKKLCDNFRMVYMFLPISTKSKIDWIYKIGQSPKTDVIVFVNGRHMKNGYTDLSQYIMFGAMPK
jgi:hypothetical protein